MAYWPLNEPYAAFAHDETVNNRAGSIYNLDSGVSGLYGNCYQFSGESDSEVLSDALLLSVFDMKEYSVFMLIKYDEDAYTEAVRIINIWNSTLDEYSAIEIRTDSQLGIFLLEDGNNQTIGTDVLGTMEDEVWTEIVLFNSESDGVAGVYINKVLKQSARTVTGLVNNVPGVSFPAMGGFLPGFIQHIAFFNHKLTQAEVDSI